MTEEEEERALHKQRLLDGLVSSLSLMPYTKEDGGLFLLDLNMRGISNMLSEDLISEAGAKALRQQVLDAFRAAHPQLSTLFQFDAVAGMSSLNEVIAQLLSGDPPDDELVLRVRAALQEFRKRGLETIQ